MHDKKILPKFYRRREIWFPTLLGWFLILLVPAVPTVGWWFWGESILSLNQREKADVLVVEGWAGEGAIKAAAEEFKRGHYQWVVTSGGPNEQSWGSYQWTYARIARDRLILHGILDEKIIMAPCAEVDGQRTRESALAVHRALADKNIHPLAINVFTRGAHARRSRLIYSRIFAPTITVGVISWLPEQAHTKPWWHSTSRTKDLLIETVGFFYELALAPWR